VLVLVARQEVRGAGQSFAFMGAIVET